MNKSREIGYMVYNLFLRRLENLTICRGICKGSSFSSVILTLTEGPTEVTTTNTPSLSAVFLSFVLTEVNLTGLLNRV